MSRPTGGNAPVAGRGAGRAASITGQSEDNRDADYTSPRTTAPIASRAPKDPDHASIAPDFDESERFLRWLDPEAEAFTFQTFDDDKDRKDQRLVRILHGGLEDLWDELCALSARGAGVFVAINKTDLRGRKAENILSVRAVFADLDGAPIPDPWPLQPSGVVDSSPGRGHAYWLVADCPQGRFGEIQARISACLDSDPSVTDLARVMRLPGLPHKKAEPFMVRARYLTEPIWSTYTIEEIENAFPAVASRKEKPRGNLVDSIVAALEATGCGPVAKPGGKWELASCPWAAAHTTGPGGAVYLAPHHGGNPEPVFHCRHAHCAGRTLGHLRGWLREHGHPVEPPAAVDFSRVVAPTARGNGPPDQGPPFRLAPVRELLAAPRPLTWLVRGYLPPESLVLLFGDPEAGKSLLAVDWAACVATGAQWRDSATGQGSVIYVAGEGQTGLRRHLKAWATHRQVEDELREAPLFVSETGAAFVEPGSLGRVIEAIDAVARDHGPPVLIVVDTLHRNLGPGDENDAGDIGAFIQAADALRTRYKATVLVVHHSGHGDKTRSRGSSAIRGAVDMEFRLESQQGRRTLAVTKAKDAPPPAPAEFDLKLVALPWSDADGSPETSVVLTPADPAHSGTRHRPAPPNVRLGFETLMVALEESGEASPSGWAPPGPGERPERVVPLEAWRATFYAKHTGENRDAKRKAFQRARGDLTRGGAVACHDDIYWPNPLLGLVCSWTDLREVLAAHTLMSEVRREAA